MNKITLVDLVEKKGQTFVADKLGVSTPAISKAIKAGRLITITVRPDDTYEAEEHRPFPSQNRAGVGAA